MACTPTRLGFELTSCTAVPDGLHSTVATSSVLDCAALCLMSTCLSVVFHTLTEDCYLNPKKVHPDSCTAYLFSDDVVVFNKLEVAEELESRCPSIYGYSYDETLDKCLKFHDNARPYLKASSVCRDEGGTRLVRVDSGDLDDYLYRVGYGGYIEGTYDGADWRYGDKANLTYTNWYNGQPVAGNGCIIKTGQTWSSIGCMTGQKYCCEYV